MPMHSMSCLMTRRPTTSTLFPYTTLFRSLPGSQAQVFGHGLQDARSALQQHDARAGGIDAAELSGQRVAGDLRSEEHTSELQSRLHLVCRLLLEKKKKTHLVYDPL